MRNENKTAIEAAAVTVTIVDKDGVTITYNMVTNVKGRFPMVLLGYDIEYAEYYQESFYPSRVVPTSRKLTLEVNY